MGKFTPSCTISGYPYILDESDLDSFALTNSQRNKFLLLRATDIGTNIATIGTHYNSSMYPETGYIVLDEPYERLTLSEDSNEEIIVGIDFAGKCAGTGR